uniref:At2g35280-like TPR domain-containing protein n=1 Tax=Brassica oleracea TaxID=3712 RepID=A0A3P6E5U3_BRAOL|nr:unnamed protein product [Brassica oleracea]
MDYFPILELPEEIQALVVERLAGNSFTDLYGLRASCKTMNALAERSRVNHFYDVLSVPRRLNMPSELFKTCYTERNPSTLYMKGVQFFFIFNLQEEGLAFMKLAADEGYERAVYTYAMTRKIFWGDEEYFARFTRESVVRIGKLVRSLKWAWGLTHSDEFLAKRDEFISTVVPSFYSCQCVPVMERDWVLWYIENSKGDKMCNRCFWIKDGEDVFYQNLFSFYVLCCDIITAGLYFTLWLGCCLLITADFCKKGSLQLRLSFNFIMTEIFCWSVIKYDMAGLIKYVIAELLLLKG